MAWRGVQDEKGSKAREKAFAHDSMLKISMPRHLVAQSNAWYGMKWECMTHLGMTLHEPLDQPSMESLNWFGNFGWH